MTVKEAINLLSYGSAYEIKGAYSGKIYHRSYINSSKNLDKYIDKEVCDTPFYVALVVRGAKYSNEWCTAVVGIWMHDYDMRKDDTMIIDGYTAECLINDVVKDTPTGYVVKDTPTGTAKAKSYNVPVMQGWVCPLCGRGLSPYVSVCPCKGVKMDITCRTVERGTDE